MEGIDVRFKQLLKELGITQDSFAKKIGVSQAFVSGVCWGKSSPSDRTIRDICRVFHVDENWLRHGEMPSDGKIIHTSKEDEIAALFGDLWAENETADYKRRLISALASFDEEDWLTIGKLIDKLAPPK